MRRLPATPYLGCAAILVDFLGLGMIAPILPGIVSSRAVGIILSAQYMAVVVGQLVVGALADRYGRRRLIIAVMLLDAIFFTATGFTQDVATLIALRCVAGFAAPVALGISYVAEVSRNLPPAKAQFNFALIGVSFNVGSLVGAAAGGLLGASMWLPANVGAGVVPMLVAIWGLASEDTKQVVLASPATATATADATADATAAPSAEPAAAIASAPPSAASPPTTTSTATGTKPPAATGLRSVLRTPEFASVLLGYVANGIFQGGFFSLMPVLLNELQRTTDAANATANGTTTTDDENDAADDEAAQVIAAVIIAAAVMQVLANLFLVRASLRRWGALGHMALCHGANALLLLPTAVLIGHRGTARSAVLGGLCVLYPLTYVCSASALTVLNMSGAKYAQRYGAPVGTVTGIGRSIFSIAFGVAPVSTIGLYGVAAWLPLALMAALAAASSLAFAFMKARRWADPVPPAARGRASGEGVEGKAASCT
tara:strand:- start:314 stop:1774 length:1461 start_codon:yes stop_codon:yes gene_type:complete